MTWHAKNVAVQDNCGIPQKAIEQCVDVAVAASQETDKVWVHFFNMEAGPRIAVIVIPTEERAVVLVRRDDDALTYTLEEIKKVFAQQGMEIHLPTRDEMRVYGHKHIKFDVEPPGRKN